MPTKHHTKDKGDLGVLKAKADLCSKGFMVLSPETEHSPFDVAVYKDGSFWRVQVKYREKKKGAVQVSMRSSWSDRLGTHVSKIDLSCFDILCIYCPESDSCYYLNAKDINSESVTLRIDKSANNQSSGIRSASEYKNFPHP